MTQNTIQGFNTEIPLKRRENITENGNINSPYPFFSKLGDFLLLMIVSIYTIGYVSFYITAWQAVTGKGIFSFIISFFLIEFCPVINLYLGLKLGYTLGECISIFYFPPILLFCGIPFVIRIITLLNSLFVRYQSILLNLTRWILFLPVCFFIEKPFNSIYFYFVKIFFFYYNETIIPFLLHPYIYAPIECFISFSIAYFLIPKFKKTILTILLIGVLLAKLNQLLTIFQANSNMNLLNFHNITTTLSIILSPLFAYIIILLSHSNKN